MPEPMGAGRVHAADGRTPDARDLARRESECCAFFMFSFEADGDDVAIRINVPPAYVEVLDALEARAR